MPNTPLSPAPGEPGNSPTTVKVTSEHFKPPSSQGMNAGSHPSSLATTRIAGTATPSTKTSKLSDLDTLRLLLSLLAGYLAKIQMTKRGRVFCEELTMKQPNGKKYKVLKILIGVDNAGAVIVETSSELEFDVVEREVTENEPKNR